MGVYATVKSPVPCQRCHQGSVDHAQIKVGDCHQLPEYQVGDRIRFAAGGGARFGTPEDIRDAVAIGYPNPCDYCGGFQLLTVTLRDQRIVSVRFRSLASYEVDELLIGRERRGRGPFIHGARTRVEPIDIAPLQRRLRKLDWPGHTLPRTLGWLVAGWLGRAIVLEAQRDADGRLEVDWSLGTAPLPAEFPHLLADALSTARLSSAELKRWDFICARAPSPPSSIYELGIPADSLHPAVYQSVIAAAQRSYW